MDALEVSVLLLSAVIVFCVHLFIIRKMTRFFRFKNKRWDPLLLISLSMTVAMLLFFLQESRWVLQLFGFRTGLLFFTVFLIYNSLFVVLMKTKYSTNWKLAIFCWIIWFFAWIIVFAIASFAVAIWIWTRSTI
jgi:hypothetical protein